MDHRAVLRCIIFIAGDVWHVSAVSHADALGHIVLLTRCGHVVVTERGLYGCAQAMELLLVVGRL